MKPVLVKSFLLPVGGLTVKNGFKLITKGTWIVILYASEVFYMSSWGSVTKNGLKLRKNLLMKSVFSLPIWGFPHLFIEFFGI